MNDEIKIKTLTPLWTGDIDGECNKIKETGIIGSLRWWYEALVRGLGGYACDPTDSICKFDYKKYHATGNVEDGLHDVCDACRLFGCTDWRRRFRIETEYNGKSVYDGSIKITVDQNNGWYLPGGICGDLDFKIVDDEYQKPIMQLLNFISKWGAIGAKTQQGYGVIRLNGNVNSRSYTKELIDFIKKNMNGNDKQNQEYLPNIKDFFFSKIYVNEINDENLGDIKIIHSEEKKEDLLFKLRNEYNFLPTAPKVRYYLREHFRETYKGNDDLRHFLCGFISTKRRPVILNLKEKILKKMGSKIFVSHAFKENDKWAMNLWGWIPEYVSVIGNTNRDKLFNEFKKNIELKIKNIFKEDSDIRFKWKTITDDKNSKNIENFILDLGDSK